MGMLGFAAQCPEAPPLPPPFPPLIFADVNLDQSVDVLDTVVLSTIILNGEVLVGAEFTAADVDSNGVVNIAVRHQGLWMEGW